MAESVIAKLIEKNIGVVFEIEPRYIWFANHIAKWTISPVERLDGKISYAVNVTPFNPKKYTGYGKICDTEKELIHTLALDELIKQSYKKRGRKRP